MRKTSARGLVLGVLVVGTAACVKIPGEVEAAFAPAQPIERSNFRRQPGAPSAMGFVTEEDLRPIDAGSPLATEGGADADAGVAVGPITLVDAGLAITPEGGTP